MTLFRIRCQSSDQNLKFICALEATIRDEFDNLDCSLYRDQSPLHAEGVACHLSRELRVTWSDGSAFTVLWFRAFDLAALQPVTMNGNLCCLNQAILVATFNCYQIIDLQIASLEELLLAPDYGLI